MSDARPPPRKRIRQEAQNSSTVNTPREPRLFAPFRVLGLITNHVPFVLQTRSHKGAVNGPRIHLLTCLGRAWALWEGGKMGLLFVGPDAPALITSMAMDGDAVWVASGQHAIKYIRGKEVDRLSNPLGTQLALITVFGSHILALTTDGGKLLIWDTTDGEFLPLVQFDSGFTAISILHPATYLNKVLIASTQGAMQLWNIRTQTCIHKYNHSQITSSKANVTDAGSTSFCAITALTQSPAIDIVGVGFVSGEISLYDIRADERLMRMFMEGGGIRALGFRSDGHQVLASASSMGHIALWDLSSGGRLLHIIRGAHDGAICAVEWVPGQPVLISSAEDNSVKQWLFDSETAAPRLLKFRSGHHAPPHLIRFYGHDGKQLLTASRDRSLRCTSVVRDSRSFELSQGSLAKKASALSITLASLKFPPITSLSYSSARAKDWDDILTAHTDETFARSWTMLGKKVGKHSLNIAATGGKDKNSGSSTGSIKAVCVSACGNFGIASSSTGTINMWNMQSGILRKTFDVGPCPPELSNGVNVSSKKKGKERCITGLASDALNKTLIASTLDGTICFFDFHTTALEHVTMLPSAAVLISLQRDSGLLAVVCDDLVVRILDIETRKVVRELGGFRGRVLDIAFSPDSRWLVASALDSTIRTFDVPSGRLIDAFRTSSVATSLALSPTNDFLATSHVDSVGVYLWANRAQFTEVSFRSIVDDDILEVSLPSVQGIAEDALQSPMLLGVGDPQVDVFSTPLQLDGDLITLTLLPRSRWQTLLNLDVIQQRNKPKEPPKAPERAPFFLPTLPGGEPRFVPEKTKEDQKKTTKRLKKTTADVQSAFHQKLVENSDEDDYETFFAYAKTLSPAALDLEIHSLLSTDSLQSFLTALKSRLKSHRDFEAVQAMQKVFLRIHADALISDDELKVGLEQLREAQRNESERLLELVSSSLGTLAFVRETL